MQMRAMDKLLAGRESQGTTVAQAAAAAPTMAATGPLSKVSTVTVVQQNLCKVSVVTLLQDLPWLHQGLSQPWYAADKPC